MSKLGISVLDADFIVKTAVFPSLQEKSLLEKILDAGEKFYIHQQVREEVLWPQAAVDLLDRFIQEKRVILLNDINLLELLDKHFPMPKRTLLGNLKECCEMFGTDYYTDYFSRLEPLLLDGHGQEQFGISLYNLEVKLKEDCGQKGCRSNLGEIKTAMMAVILSLLGVGHVTVFLSDDRRARNIIVSQYSARYHEIKGISVIGCFYILMKNGLTLEEASRYMNALETKEFKLIGQSSKWSGADIIEAISANRLVLLANGTLKFKGE